MIHTADVLEAQKSEEKREHLIQSSTENIRRYVARASGRWVDIHDDLYSIGLIAFNDAVTAFEEGKGTFSAFASRVVSNRVRDYLRKTQITAREIPFSVLEQEDEDGEAISFEIADHRSQVTELTLEITTWKAALEQYHILFQELPEASPKAQKTKKVCQAVIRFATEHPQCLEYLRSKKQLPVKLLVGHMKVNEKILQRHRKYIIAGIVVCSGDFPALRRYFLGGESN